MVFLIIGSLTKFWSSSQSSLFVFIETIDILIESCANVGLKCSVNRATIVAVSLGLSEVPSLNSMMYIVNILIQYITENVASEYCFNAIA